MPFLVWSQDPFYINYDTKDGLPSSETYFAHEDENGLIWIATDRGVCSYDGYKFSTFTTKDGLADNTNFRIFSDRKQRLWFTALNGSLSVYENGLFQDIPLHKDTIYNKQSGYAIQLLFDKWNNIIVAKTRSDRNQEALFHLDGNDFSVSRKSIYHFKEVVWRSKEREEILVKIGDKYLFYNKKNGYSVNTVQIYPDSSKWLIGFNGAKIKELSKTQFDHKFEKIEILVHNFFKDHQKNLWLCTPDGLLLYKHGNLELPPRRFFSGLDVTSLLMDRDGSYWLTSREKGIFWIPSFEFQSMLRPAHNFEIQRTLSIAQLPNFLLFGSVNNGIIAVNNQFNLLPELEEWNEVPEIKRMYSSGNIIYLKDYSRIEDVNGTLKSVINGPRNNTRLIKKLKNGFFILSNSFHRIGYSVYSNKISEPSFYPFKELSHSFKSEEEEIEHFNLRINCIEEYNNSIWFGGIYGLYHLDSDELFSNIPQKDTAELMNIRVEDIICLDAQNLWIATLGNGLIFKNDKYYRQFLENDGLSSNLINKIFLENDSTLWAGTNKGLSKIYFKQEGAGVNIQSITNFSTADGLISNYINDLSIWKEHLWLATNKGINYLRPEKLVENKIPPLIHIEEILVGDQAIQDQKNPKLKYNQNDLIFNYLGISFKKPENENFYRYRMSSNQEEAPWYYTDNRSIRFLNLAPGYYNFEVTAQNKNGYWSDQTANYLFTIKAHYSEQLWFKILTGLLIALLIVVGLFYRIRIIQKREDQKRKLKDAELNALRNQMNPHFIFNSLNSIQSFIFQQDAKKANHYLSKFSKLMRSSLEYSKLEYISINEEINYIRTYLDLEKLRFDDRFEFRIEVDPGIPIHHYFIPPLLLQPILENSIKHAFKNVSYLGLLEIKFLNTDLERVLEIIILDNGIGIKEKKSNEAKHQSMGLSIIENRIKLLNESNNQSKNKATFNFSNRCNSKQEVIGTQAHFLIPIQFNKND